MFDYSEYIQLLKIEHLLHLFITNDNIPTPFVILDYI